MLRRGMLGWGAGVGVAAIAAGWGLWSSRDRSDIPRRYRKPNPIGLPDRTAELTDRFLGPEWFEIIRNPDRIAAYVLRTPEGHLPWEYEPRVDYWPITTGPIEVPPDIREEFSATLTDPTNYEWEKKPACHVAYGARLTFERADDMLDLMFCFGCAHLGIAPGESASGGLNFNYAQPTLLGLFRKLFPHDESLATIRI